MRARWLPCQAIDAPVRTPHSLIPASGLYSVHHTARPQGRAPLFLEDAQAGETGMADQILMPKATAVWLVDNTSLTFEQIADFAGLHPLEVKGIADGEAARDS